MTKYYIKGHGEIRAYAMECRFSYSLDELRLAAEDAAEYDFRSRDGWEYSWPVTYTIIDDDGKEHDFVVDREDTPTFRAREQG